MQAHTTASLISGCHPRAGWGMTPLTSGCWEAALEGPAEDHSPTKQEGESRTTQMPAEAVGAPEPAEAWPAIMVAHAAVAWPAIVARWATWLPIMAEPSITAWLGLPRQLLKESQAM